VTNPNPPVQVTVFVSRKPGPNLVYYKPRFDPNWTKYGTVDWTKNPYINNLEWPRPVKLVVQEVVAAKNQLEIIESDVDAKGKEFSFINDGYTIVDNRTGRIYRVLERLSENQENIIILDRPWTEATPANVWVVPPPVSGGRRPCVAVYQRIIRF
jgi:hypothetical protein